MKNECCKNIGNSFTRWLEKEGVQDHWPFRIICPGCAKKITMELKIIYPVNIIEVADA